MRKYPQEKLIIKDRTIDPILLEMLRDLPEDKLVPTQADLARCFPGSIERPEDLYHHWLAYWLPDTQDRISRNINERLYRLESGAVSSRTINHWEKQGLFEADRGSGRGWRKYSVIDKVWLEIIVELRKFGFSLGKIKKVKTDLEFLRAHTLYSQFPLLEMYITIEAILLKRPVYLLVFTDGSTGPVTYSEYKSMNERMNNDNHIKINLNPILQSFFPFMDLKPIIHPHMDLESREMSLIFMIRMQDYESIKIKTNSGKIVMLEVTKVAANEARIINLINEGDFQDIEIKKRDGKIICIRQKTIIKYSDGKKPS